MITRGIIKGIKNSKFVSIVSNYTIAKKKSDKILNVSRGDVNQRKTQLANVKYEVYLPLIDGGDDTVTHEAVYCQLPHETTYFNVNDVVYVAAVDMDFGDLVILGMADRDGLLSILTGKLESRFRFAHETESLFGVSDIDYLECSASDSLFVVPNKLTVKTGEKSAKQINMSTLSGMPDDKNLGTIVWGPEQGGLGVSISENASQEERNAAAQKLFESLNLVSIEIISSAAFDNKSAQTGDKGLKKNTLYFIYNSST